MGTQHAIQKVESMAPPAEKDDSKKGKVAKIETILAARLPNLQAMASKYLDPDRLLKVLIFEVSKNPDLMNCTAESLYGCMMECAEMGLEPGPQKHVALVARNCKVKGANGEPDQWVKRAEVMPMWRGLREQAWRTGALMAPPRAVVVYENDEFDYTEGLRPNLVHKPARGERGKRIAAYAVARFKEFPDEPVFEVAFGDEIEHRRRQGWKKKKGSDERIKPPTWSDVWEQHPDAQWRKTAMRILCDRSLPLHNHKIEQRLLAEEPAIYDDSEDGEPETVSRVPASPIPAATTEALPATTSQVKTIDQPAEEKPKRTRKKAEPEPAPANEPTRADNLNGILSRDVTISEIVAAASKNQGAEVSAISDVTDETLATLAQMTPEELRAFVAS